MSIASLVVKAAELVLAPWLLPVHGFRALWTPVTQDFYPLADQSGVRMSVNAKTGFISIRGRNLREVGRRDDWIYFHVDGDAADWFDVDVGKL